MTDERQSDEKWPVSGPGPSFTLTSHPRSGHWIFIQIAPMQCSENQFMKIISLLVTMVLKLNKSFVVLKVEALINLTGDPLLREPD